MLDVDDLYPEHPKLVGLGTWCEVAGWLNLAALAWCKRYLTDGVIPRAAVWRLASFRGMAIDGEPVTPEAVAARLVETGLWTERGRSYVIHDFLDYQESRADVLRRRAADRKRKKLPKSQASSPFQPDSARNPRGLQTDSGSPLPLPLPKEDPDARARATQVEGRTRAREEDRSTHRIRRGPARAAPNPPRAAGPPMRLGDILAQAMAAASRAPPSAAEVPTGVGAKR
jgi:hypothetical protein